MSISFLRSAITTAGGTPAHFAPAMLWRQLITAMGGAPTKFNIIALMREFITSEGGTPTSYAYVPLLRQIITTLGGTPTSFKRDVLEAQMATLTFSVTVFDPATLFAAGELGAWYDPSDLSTMYQDSAGTVPAVVGQPVGRINDKSGRGNHWRQATTAAKFLLASSGGLNWLEPDGVDDSLSTAGGAAASFAASSDVFMAVYNNTNDLTYVTLYNNPDNGTILGIAQSGQATAANLGATGAVSLVNGVAVSPDTRNGLYTAIGSTAAKVFELDAIPLALPVPAIGGYGGFESAVRFYGAIIAPAQSAGNRASIRTYLGAKAGIVL